jgi:hypothetical protein
METEIIQNLLKDSSFKGITMHRVNYNGKRAYIRPEPFKVYSGLTGAIESATFRGDMDSRRITKWREAQIEQFGSVEKHSQHMDAMADFGTYLHMALVEIWNKKEYTFDQDAAREWFMQSDKENGIEHNELSMNMRVFEHHKAVCSLMQFVHDEVSEIIAIETMACSDQYSIATPCDIIYKDKKGIVCNVNMKTSNQIGEHHKNQVSIEKFLWNTTYPELQVQKTGVWRGKDWMLAKGVPTYELVFVPDDAERTNMILRKFDCVLSDPSASYDNFKRETRVFTGTIALGEKPNIAVKTIEQAFMESQEITVQ